MNSRSSWIRRIALALTIILLIILTALTMIPRGVAAGAPAAAP